MIDDWFPCNVVDEAVGTPEGSGRSEKAIFTWFASRPIAQARASVLAALLPDDESLRPLVKIAVAMGDRGTLTKLAKRINVDYAPEQPVVLDVFSGRGIIPLEAARLGVTAVGVDYSPVATLAGRLLADFPLRNWTKEPRLPFVEEPSALEGNASRLLVDVRAVLDEVNQRQRTALARYYPANPDGTFPWGYLWAVTIPCDGCGRRFPLVGSLTLRHPYERTNDLGQAFHLHAAGDEVKVEIIDGAPDQIPPVAAYPGRKGKSARCIFCDHTHTLSSVKQKGIAGQFQDVPLLAADLEDDTKKVFRKIRKDEVDAAYSVDLAALEPLGELSAVPDEQIPAGNEDTVRPSGYGYRTYGQVMSDRQTLQFVETARSIRAVHSELVEVGLSPEYAGALTSYATATLIRRLRRSTRGVTLLCHGRPDGSKQNRVQVTDLFASESKISFSFDYFEAGIAEGPGTWQSVAQTGLTPLARHISSLSGKPARFRQGSATALPFRDGTVDAVITDPPYYNMIDYSDASDLFHVWARRVLHDVIPDLFGSGDLQPKEDEIIVKRGNATGEHRTKEFYEESLAKAFAECKRVLKADGTLVVVFGHSDPDAWKRLLAALHTAGFVVTRTWPSRTETANTGVASIKVTVAIACQVAPAKRDVATAAEVDRQVVEAIKEEVRQWEDDGLALTDQLMAAYGPAMEVYGRFSRILQPDGTVAPIERYLTLARVAVRDAVALKVDSIPLDTFDAITRFALFWLRLYGQGNCPKGEALFLAQADGLRLDGVRDGLLTESKGGYRINLEAPAAISEATPIFDLVRAAIASWQSGGGESVAELIASAGRSADDEHMWAVVAELSHRLPVSSGESKALAGLQRNRSAIERHVKEPEEAAKEKQEQFALEGFTG